VARSRDADAPARRACGRRITLTVALGACLATCGGEELVPVAPAHPKNLILVSIDTLRADRLGCYGYERDTSPAIDRFAARGVRFANAVAESSWTIPSHVTMLSGLSPVTHGVRRPDQRPSRAVRLLAERLEEAGIYTVGITDGGWLSAEWGFERGFHSFHAERRGLERSLAMARDYVRFRAERGRYFAFLHTYDVHCPYDPAQPFDELFASAGRASFPIEGKCGNPDLNAMGLTPAQALYLSDRYDGSVREADAALSGFFEFLESTGRLADTVIVIVSDHGEELLEHGQVGHERTLFGESLRVPLLIVAPGLEPRVVEEPVGLADVLPTVIELLGLPPVAGVDGRSLVPFLRGALLSAPTRGRFSELGWQVELDSWLSPEEHLILDRASGTVRLFDLRADPSESIDRAPAEPERAQELRVELERMRGDLEARALPVEGRGELGEEELRALAELGYAGAR
jgi:arylsulfatase A-like enzyme